MPVSAKCGRPEIPLSKFAPRRRDATFSEIYELIFYNETMVRSELEVLQLLVKNKLKHHNEPAFPENDTNARNSFLADRSYENV